MSDAMDKMIAKHFHKHGFTDMDAKELFLVLGIHKKILSSSFDELDIYAFLMLLRAHTKGNSIIRELGDFIAHRKKDRGRITAFLSNQMKKYELPKGIDLSRPIIALGDPLFTTQEIKEEFKNVFHDMALKQLDDKMIDEIILCIISIFQGIKITANVDGKNTVGELIYYYSGGKNSLGLRFEVIDQKTKKPLDIIRKIFDSAAVPKPKLSASKSYISDHIIRINNEENKLVIQALDQNKLLDKRGKASELSQFMAEFLGSLSEHSKRSELSTKHALRNRIKQQTKSKFAK